MKTFRDNYDKIDWGREENKEVNWKNIAKVIYKEDLLNKNKGKDAKD